MIAFGPVPSRRLGFSLGVNNIPPKHCSYSCVYCQVGRTDHLAIQRREFYAPDKVVRDVKRHITAVRRCGGRIDYLSFVPDGEPTLDIHLGREIELLKSLGYPVAVFTNASLLWQASLRRELQQADWVSLKIDAAEEGIWHNVNRPHGRLSLTTVLEGIQEFSEHYRGFLATETMLIKDINDAPEHLSGIAKILRRLQPGAAYLSLPTRPPAETWVAAPSEETLYLAYRLFNKAVKQVELLVSEKTVDYGITGNAEEDILRTTAVQPMTEKALDELLKRDHAAWSTIHKLIAEGKLREIRYQGQRFYIRRFRRRKERI